MRKQRRLTVALALIILLAITPVLAYAATSDDSLGTANVSNAAPVISSPSLTDTSLTSKDGQQIDVNVEYWIKVTITDNNKLEDLDTVVYKLWGPSSTEGGADSESDHYTFKYTQATDTWEEVGPDPTGDSHLVIGNCQDPADQQQTSGDFRLAFKLDKIAEKTATATWSIKVIATDDSAASDSDSSLTFGVNFYVEIVVDDGTHSWTGLNPGDNDILVNGGGGSDGDIDCTITANANFNLQAKGDGALTTNGFTIPLVNVEVHKDTLGSAVGLTTSYVDIGGMTNLAAGASQAHSFKLWISVPAGQNPGAYTYTLSVQAVEYT